MSQSRIGTRKKTFLKKAKDASVPRSSSAIDLAVGIELPNVLEKWRNWAKRAFGDIRFAP